VAEKVLVIGADGMVGSAIMHEVKDYPAMNYLGTSIEGSSQFIRLDITDFDQVWAVVRGIRPRHIIIAAAMTDVDMCETKPDDSYLANVKAVQNIIACANDVYARVLFYSSDYIFDGCNGPHKPTDIPKPLSVYGNHKLLAEHYILANADVKPIIVRLTSVYGPHHASSAVRVLDELDARRRNHVPVQRGGPMIQPTWSQDVAVLSILLLQDKHERSVLQFAGPDRMSRQEYIERIEEVVNERALIVPSDNVPVREGITVAKRPMNGGLVPNVTIVNDNRKDLRRELDEGLSALLNHGTNLTNQPCRLSGVKVSSLRVD
jgi:dTDP-4-dehydrorhamnose reductase